MKIHLALLGLFLTIPILACSQKFVSDSTCYQNTTTGEIIRCDIPSLDPGTSTHYRDLCEVDRNGDFIKIVHWYSKPIEESYVNSEGDTLPSLGTGNVIRFRIDNRDQEEITYVTKSIKRSFQVFEGRASTGSSLTSVAISWQLYDLNDDEIWDILILSWIDGSPIMRVIYCHAE